MTIGPGIFFTPPATGTTPGQTALSGQALGNAGGLFGAAGNVSFLDLLLGGLTGQENKNKKSDGDAETTGDPLLALLAHKTVKIIPASQEDHPSSDAAVAALLAHNPKIMPAGTPEAPAFDVAPSAPADDALIAEASALIESGADINALAETLNGIEPGADVAAVATLEPSGIKKFIDYLKGLTTGIPESSRAEIIKIPPGLLKKFVPDALTFTPDDPAQTQAPGLISTGLTPEALTKFFEDLAARVDAGESFIVGLARLLPPQAARDAVFIPRALILSPDKTTANPPAVIVPDGGIDADMDLLAAQMNDLVVGETTEDVPIEPKNSKSAAPPSPITAFERFVKMIEAYQTPSTSAPALKPEVTVAPPAATITGKNHELPALPISFTTGAWMNAWIGGLDWSQNPGNGSTGTGAATGINLNVTGPAALTGLINNAPNAALPHPSTQMIATTISRAAADGQSKNITVKMDPPELGRVEVRMEFTKEKTLKVHLAVEKQETYLMLQRDVHVLERTLQNSGIDTAGGMSLELAQDGNMFGQNGDSRDGGRNDSGGGTAGANPDDGEIVTDSTMTLYVDPETGLTHYDIWA